MADASGSRLNIGAPVEKRGRGCPRGSKNKATAAAAVASSSAPVKRLLRQVQVLLLLMLLLLRPESIPSFASPARSAVRFSAYR
jgi:hypothetical protein